MADQQVKHTPGPWEVIQHRHIDNELWLSVNKHADTQGRKEWIAEIKYVTTGDAEKLANARLIAASPDLLAALKEYHKANRLHHDEDARLFDLSEAAIEKATATHHG